MNERRLDAARRVRATYPPLTEIFAALRAAQGEESVAEPPPPPRDPLALTLFAAARTASGGGDDVAVSLALAVEEALGNEVRAGAAAAHAAGVPAHDVPTDAAVDAALSVLAPYAEVVAASPARAPEPDAALVARLRGVARSAGVVAATRDTGWVAVQRFGAPWCPRPGCYGRDGTVLTDELPPFGDGCNCYAEARRG